MLYFVKSFFMFSKSSAKATFEINTNNVIVKVNISNKHYTIDLNSEGQGNITINDIESGSHEIIVYFEGNDDYLSTNKTGTIHRLGDSDKTFTDLNNTINGNNDPEIPLEYNYYFVEAVDSQFKNGIVISRDIVINGNNKVIDGSGLARAFYVAEGVNSFTLKDIKVQNTYADNGAVVYIYNAMDGYVSKDINNIIIINTF